ncbi:MAG TPA: Crp/Fnr family transcriptional regulator, partial [Rectinemataceae bacterium]|nr:Crp/Fnr family transcriptional regulator [Rectinemataceae bacterium]
NSTSEGSEARRGADPLSVDPMTAVEGSLRTVLPNLARDRIELVGRFSAPAQLRANRALFYQGDEGEAAFLVLSGRVRLLRLKGGVTTALRDCTAGSWFGLAETSLDLPRPCDALAVEASVLRRIGRYNLAELLREAWFKDLALHVLAREQYLLYDQLDSAGAIERVARALVSRSGVGFAEGPDSRATLRIPTTQAELAGMTGLSRETVNRSLRRLESLGFLETSRGEILVYDLPGLRAYED